VAVLYFGFQVNIAFVLPILKIEIMDNPLVSVVIIFLNAGHFLEDAIKSVLGQSHRNWELLLVDDGSTDVSTQIAKRYAQNSQYRICYLQHPNHENLGMSASRNLGARQGSGEYISFLDADDVWLPENLENQIEILQRYPNVAMVYCYLKWWYSWTGVVEDVSRDFIEKKRGVTPNVVIPPPEIAIFFLKRQATASPHVLVRRVAFDKVGGFDENFPCVYEDQVFCTKIALNFPVYVSSESWYLWRQHPDAFHVLESKKYHELWYSYLEWFKKYVKYNRNKNPRLLFTMWYTIAQLRHAWLFGPLKRRLASFKKQTSKFLFR